MSMELESYVDRDSLLGKPTHWKVSDLGVAQLRHDYPVELLDAIYARALELKASVSAKRHLNLRFIRAAHEEIPEIKDLIHWPGRLERLGRIAGTAVEPYPVSVIGSAITFMGEEASDGAVDWHTDGIPLTEIIPLAVDDVTGGQLAVYRGNHETGLHHLESIGELPSRDVLTFEHRPGYSTFAQLIRVLHRTVPLRRGRRVSLNLNLRSVDRPYFSDNAMFYLASDNAMFYLAADNPDFRWQEEYVSDVKHRQVPAYLDQRACT